MTFIEEARKPSKADRIAFAGCIGIQADLAQILVGIDGYGKFYLRSDEEIVALRKQKKEKEPAVPRSLGWT